MECFKHKELFNYKTEILGCGHWWERLVSLIYKEYANNFWTPILRDLWTFTAAISVLRLYGFFNSATQLAYFSFRLGWFKWPLRCCCCYWSLFKVSMLLMELKCRVVSLGWGITLHSSPKLLLITNVYVSKCLSGSFFSTMQYDERAGW